jgi:dTMP kinase
MSLFITFEGPDGSGKSTQIKLLSETLTAAGYDVLTVREPGGTAISEQIRDVVHSLRNQEMSDRAECLLYNAARAQLVDQLIVPQLKRGGIVLSDRYADSTLAYQGYGRGLNLDAVRSVIAFATNNLKPDVTFYLDLAVEEGLARRKRGAGEWNRLDDQALEFHRRVRAGYLQIAQDDPQRWVRVDAARAVEEIQKDIVAQVWQRLRDGEIEGKKN